MNTNTYQDEEILSIWQNIKIIFQGAAKAVSSSTHAVATTAAIADSLAQAGLIMAKSNEELVTIDTQGEHQERLADLYTKYPQLKDKKK